MNALTTNTGDGGDDSAERLRHAGRRAHQGLPVGPQVAHHEVGVKSTCHVSDVTARRDDETAVARSPHRHVISREVVPHRGESAR